MKNKPIMWQDQRAFTLIEILCVLVIISVIVSITFTRILQADAGAKQVALIHGVSELNLRENMTWAVEKVSVGTVDEEKIWLKLDKNLGDAYSWDTGPIQSGDSKLRFKETAITVARSISTNSQPGKWR